MDLDEYVSGEYLSDDSEDYDSYDQKIGSNVPDLSHTGRQIDRETTTKALFTLVINGADVQRRDSIRN